jgi:hypothetical protein
MHKIACEQVVKYRIKGEGKKSRGMDHEIDDDVVNGTWREGEKIYYNGTGTR